MGVSHTLAGGELLLGELLVREGLVTEAQISEALRTQRDGGGSIPLGRLLVEQKYLKQRQLDAVLTAYNKRVKLGDLLVRVGVLTTKQLDYALGVQKKNGERLGHVLSRLNYVSDDDLRQAIASQLDVPYVDLDSLVLDKSLNRMINRNYAKRHNLVPIASLESTLTVCIDDPTDRAVVDELRRLTGRLVTVVTASHDAISRALTRLYDAQPETSNSALQLAEMPNEALKSKYAEDPRTKTADVIVRKILTIAIENRASDVHIESLANRLQIRFRIDGMLVERDLGDLQELCNQGSREIVSRVKILGKLDIAERRRPQDGSFRLSVERSGDRSDVDLRVSIVPGYYGESVVLRILDKKNAPASLDELAFPKPVTDKLRQLLERPAGIVLVTGPTGSGKSTTLYAALMTVYRPHLRILTAEDPIEYIYDQFSQSEVNADIGNTFANYLRAFLRHDPEVIMVGEIRDEDTAGMAFRASQTGHLLLSTLHTNTAIGTVPRLLDLGVDPNTLSSSLIGVLSQRLVRKVCKACKHEYRPSADLLKEFYDGKVSTPFIKGEGCKECNFTGYRGRAAIVEMWSPNDEDIMLINKRAPMDELQVSARKHTMSMAESARIRLAEQQTTLEELMRVLPYDAVVAFRQAGRQ